MPGFSVASACGTPSTSIVNLSVALQRLGPHKLAKVALAEIRLLSLKSRSEQIRAIAVSQSISTSQLGSSSIASGSGAKRALISLSDNSDLALLGRGLQSLGYMIVSTGGTATALENAGVSVTKVEHLVFLKCLMAV